MEYTVNQVETEPTTLMLMEQASAAATSAILSAGGLGATVGSPVAASASDVDAATDVAFRVLFAGGEAGLVVSGGLVAALAPATGPDLGALGALVDLGARAGAERLQVLVDGCGDVRAVEMMEEGVAAITWGEASRVDVDVDGEPTGWIMWIGSPLFIGSLQARVSEATVVDAIDYPDLGEGAAPASTATDISFLSDVTMGVTVELGRTIMRVREVLQLTQGSVIELDRAAGALVDVLISGSVVARGEVVVLDDQLGVRVIEIVDSMQ
jgi:flagellar motor switch protein FliN/FliY